MPTVGAGDVRRGCRAALRAGLKLLGSQSMVRPAFARARIGMFTFGDGHREAPEYCWMLDKTESPSLAMEGQGVNGLE